MTANSVFNAYLDANIILMLAACLWALTRFVLNRTVLRHAALMQLQLIYGVLLAVAVAPWVVVLFNLLQGAGVIDRGLAPNISDYALAQYLNGRFEMAPTQFETLWMSRTVFAQNVTSLGSSAGTAVAAVLGVGFAAYVVLLARNVLTVRALIGHSYVWRRFRGIEIRLTDRACVPFSTRGLRRRYIILPSALLTEADVLRITVAHELQHVRQGDLGWELVLEFLRPVFFWNPVFAYFKRQVEELRELACDQQVLMRKHFGVKAYCDCLLRVCRDSLGQGGGRRILVPSVPLVSARRGHRSTKILKQRVMSMLVRARFAPGRWITGMMVVPLLTAISIGSIATQRSGDWSQDRLMLSTIVNLERLDQRTLDRPY